MPRHFMELINTTRLTVSNAVEWMSPNQEPQLSDSSNQLHVNYLGPSQPCAQLTTHGSFEVRSSITVCGETPDKSFVSIHASLLQYASPYILSVYQFLTFLNGGMFCSWDVKWVCMNADDIEATLACMEMLNSKPYKIIPLDYPRRQVLILNSIAL